MDLVLAEAREGEVDLGPSLQLGEESSEERLVPGTRDPVEREAEEPRLIGWQVEPDDRHRAEPKAASGDEPLVSAHDDPILPSGQDRLDEPERSEAPFEGVELSVADPTWVGRIGPELIDRDLFDGEGGERSGHAGPLAFGRAECEHLFDAELAIARAP